MQSVNIQTAQNVGIDYEQAGLGPRMGAFFIDTVIQVFYIIVISYSLSKVGANSIWINMIFFLPVMFYHLISELALDGQSIGKKQLNIKVVRLDGSSPTLGGYILRWILRPVDIMIMSGAVAVISIVMSERGQRIGDMAAGTTVVRVAKPMKVTSHELIKNLQEDHRVTFPQVRSLTDHEIDIIKEALRVNKIQANAKPVLAVSEKLKQHLEVTTDLPPVKFLYTIIKDYNFVTAQA